MAKRRVKVNTARRRKPAPERKRKPAPRRGRSPRSQSLPGMGQVRDQRLDNLCESINDERAVMNAAKVEETRLIRSVLQRMHDRDVLIYVHAHLELVRVPGAEKLRVRVLKDRAQGDTTEAAAGDAEESAAEPETHTTGDAEDELDDNPDAAN